MSGDWTLPYIQERLDDLRPGQDFSLAREDMARLFGFNDVAVRRIQRFASSHGCFPLYFGGGVMFRKDNPDSASGHANAPQQASKAERPA